MSSNLSWHPIIEDRNYISDKLKFLLRKRYDQTSVDIRMRSEDLEYLKGLRDACIEDAAELITAIRKYGEIRVKEVY
jgi:hypothetical protein